ncbi:MAG: DEAD/DEAH box helicase [Elusimicrobiaceae bacterium]|nr:DEAD/DEAH box helicase [Elusimicrobiaceae bacterium]
MSAFRQLPAWLQAALTRLCITEPTQVQQSALPPALKGRDILATAQTGTGKTFAFLLPLLVYLTEQTDKAALILSPTRELAQQTQEAMQSLLEDKKQMPCALIIGGDNIHKQYADLRRHPRVIIGTPGRIIDHIGRKSLSLKNIGFFVLDEADRMLDMGFMPDVQKIGSAIVSEHQTLLFSATFPKEIEALSQGFLKDPVRVQIGSVTRPVDLVVQQMVRLSTREKLPQLVHELKLRKGSVLVFVKSKHGADRLAKQLKQYGCKVGALHGDLRQNRRRQVMEGFREGMVPVLVATDVAARGIDVADIGCVINYDLPQCAEDYIHRIGRTGRAGSVGTALSFVTEDVEKWTEICRVCRLGKVTELTKTTQNLPAPKFVPEQVRRKRKENAAFVEKPTDSALPIRAKEPAKKPTVQPKPKPTLPQESIQLKVENSAQKSGFNVVRVGGKKNNNPTSTLPTKHFYASAKKHGKHKFFKRKRK